MTLEHPRPEHPRPQFERARWLSLNGAWTCRFQRKSLGFRRDLEQEQNGVYHYDRTDKFATDLWREYFTKRPAGYDL